MKFPNESLAKRRQQEHYTRLFGPRKHCIPSESSEFPQVDVCAFEPNGERSCWTFATNGLNTSCKPISLGRGLDGYQEIIAYGKEFADWKIRLINDLLENSQREENFLNYRQVYVNKEIINPKTGKFCISFLMPPCFEKLMLNYGYAPRVLIFFWAVMITHKEYEFVLKHGGKALQNIIREAPFELFWDDGRESLV